MSQQTERLTREFDTSGYETIIGLETHIQLNTRTKMFCGCAPRFGVDVNTLTCNVCAGMPGALPAVNTEAVKSAVLLGLAFGCDIASYTKFDRKSYFYPDLPKGYQISQYDLPICKGGRMACVVDGAAREFGITRIHMEEDAGKSIHARNGDYSQVDLNRAGTPLLEMVSEPDMRAPAEAYAYLTILKQTVRYLGISDCDMEKGSLRVDGNISVRPVGQKEFNTKVEIKNVNSFRFLQMALEFEQRRQIELMRAGRGAEIRAETRHYDSAKKETRVMRVKEGVQDYRYFPEPDLMPMLISRETVEEIRGSLPELPPARRRRFQEQYQLSEYDAGELTAERDVADFYEKVARLCPEFKPAANWVLGELLRVLNEKKCALSALPVTPEQFAELVGMHVKKEITNTAAKEAFQVMTDKGGGVRDIVQALGLQTIGDTSTLETLCQKIIADNPRVVEQFRGGKDSAIGFFVGQVMKQTKGNADPNKTQEIFRALLAASKS